MKSSLNLFVILFCLVFCFQTVSAQTSALLEEEAAFKVFPNPSQADHDTYVSLQGFKAQNLLVVVYDMLGREIYSKVEIRENEGFLFTISSSGQPLSPGIYLIIASANDDIFRQKLIVK